MKYHSGQEVHKGDRILFHGEPGEIEFIAEAGSDDPSMDWYLREHGPGVMVSEPKFFGRVFIREPENAEDLVLVSTS